MEGRWGGKKLVQAPFISDGSLLVIVIMDLSQQHLADEQSTIWLAGAEVSGPIQGLKLSLEAAHSHSHSHTTPIPYSLSNADSPSSNNTFCCFSHSHYAQIIPLASGSIIWTQPSIPCKSTISLLVCLRSLILCLCSGLLLLSSSVCRNHMAYEMAFWRVHSGLVSLSKVVNSCFCSHQRYAALCWGVIISSQCLPCFFLLSRGLEMLIINATQAKHDKDDWKRDKAHLGRWVVLCIICTRRLVSL